MPLLLDELEECIAGAGNIEEEFTDSAETEQAQQEVSSTEEFALKAYSSLLSGDKTILDDAQSEV